MDEVVRPVGSSCSSEVEHTQSRDTVVETASSSDSGWRPRELAFAPFVPRGDEQRVNAAGKSLKLRAFVRKPVSLYFFLWFWLLMFVIVVNCYLHWCVILN